MNILKKRDLDLEIEEIMNERKMIHMNKFIDSLDDAKVNVNLDCTDLNEILAEKDRRIYLYDDIGEYVAQSIVMTIMDINRIDKDKKPDEREPIILYCISNGGSVTDGYAIIDAIENSITPIYTVNLGYQYSMGFLIGLAGRKRYAMPNSTFLMHDGSSMAWNSTAKVKDQLEFQEQTEKRTKKFVLSHSKLTEEEYDANYRKEFYTYADDAKKYGFTDYIIGTDCQMSEVL